MREKMIDIWIFITTTILDVNIGETIETLTFLVSI